MKLPAEPVNCLPVPIIAIPASQTVAWTAEAESKLVTDWNAERTSLSATHRRSNFTNDTASKILLEKTNAKMSREKENVDKGAETDGVNVDATPSQEQVIDAKDKTSTPRVPLECDAVPFPFNRSTGVIYKVDNTHENNSDNDNTKKININSGANNKNSSSHLANMSNAAYPKVQLKEIPVGEQYYEALRDAWRQPSERGALLPPRPSAEEYVPDDDAILEVLQDTVSARFSPGLPLHYIIQLLLPEWEEEGLFEIAKRREAQDPV